MTVLTPQEHLRRAAAARALVGHYQALELEALAAYAAASADGTLDEMFTHLDVSTLLHISDRAAQHRLRFARTLTTRLPGTLATLQRGEIEEFKAHLIADAIELLSDEHASAVEARVLDKAPAQTPAQLRAALAKAVIAVDPRGAEERHQAHRRGRRVEMRPTEEAMAMLTLHHTVERITVIHAHLTTTARRLKAAGGEPRTLEQLEADLAADLLQGCESGGGPQVEVHLTVPATTALGLDDQPAEIDGLPITASAARDLLTEASSWRWLRTDPHTGAMVDLTAPRHDPPATLATYLRVRDRTCRFPGCTRRARYCDIDHRVPWPTGPTSQTNCHCLCRRHHRAKHDGGWQVTEATPGCLEWTSPTASPTPPPPNQWPNPHPPNPTHRLSNPTHHHIPAPPPWDAEQPRPPTQPLLYPAEVEPRPYPQLRHSNASAAPCRATPNSASPA